MRPLPARGLHPIAQRRRDRPDDLVLHDQKVAGLPVVGLGPQMVADLCIDQLGADPDAAGDAAHAALRQVAHAQFRPMRDNVELAAAEAERRIARDDEKRLEARQLGDEIFRDAVAEILLLGIVAEIDERENRERRPFREAGCGLTRGAACQRAAAPDPVQDRDGFRLRPDTQLDRRRRSRQLLEHLERQRDLRPRGHAPA